MGALETAEGGPTRDQRPREEQRVWGCPFTHGRYSQLCPLCQVQPHHHLLGAFREGRHCPGLCPPRPAGFLRSRPQLSPQMPSGQPNPEMKLPLRLGSTPG